MFIIKDGQLKMYDISEDYKNYLRRFDSRVSRKENRKFYGILVSDGIVDYYVPFTSKVNKRTSSKLTINIRQGGKTIAKLLLNNMIPVNIKDAKIVDISKSKYKDYYTKEIIYLRSKKVQEEILRKINYIFNVINNENHNDYRFFNRICCDFKMLEIKCMEYENRKN